MTFKHDHVTRTQPVTHARPKGRFGWSTYCSPSPRRRVVGHRPDHVHAHWGTGRSGLFRPRLSASWACGSMTNNPAFGDTLPDGIEPCERCWGPPAEAVAA